MMQHGVEGMMQDPLVRADHYRKEAMRCGELAKQAQPAFLGNFYRRVAVRYVFMAEDILNQARARGDLARHSMLMVARPRRSCAIFG
jgi:hypothetical protein